MRQLGQRAVAGMPARACRGVGESVLVTAPSRRTRRWWAWAAAGAGSALMRLHAAGRAGVPGRSGQRLMLASAMSSSSAGRITIRHCAGPIPARIRAAGSGGACGGGTHVHHNGPLRLYFERGVAVHLVGGGSKNSALSFRLAGRDRATDSTTRCSRLPGARCTRRAPFAARAARHWQAARSALDIDALLALRTNTSTATILQCRAGHAASFRLRAFCLVAWARRGLARPKAVTHALTRVASRSACCRAVAVDGGPELVPVDRAVVVMLALLSAVPFFLAGQESGQ